MVLLLVLVDLLTNLRGAESYPSHLKNKIEQNKNIQKKDKENKAKKGRGVIVAIL